MLINKTLQGLRDYWKDKKLAMKCGLDIKEICVHEYYCIGNDSGHGYSWYKICRKCGMDLTNQNKST